MTRWAIVVGIALAAGVCVAQNQQAWFSQTLLMQPRTAAAAGGGSTLGVGLVAHYLMNDNAANQTVLDNKGSYNGSTSVSNTSALTQTGKLNGALGTGVSGYMYATGLDAWCNGKTSFTFSVWVKTTDNATSGNGNLIMGYQYYANCMIAILNTKAEFRLAASGTVVATSTNAINDGNWHLLVATYNASVARIYVDGTLQGSSSSGSGAVNCSDAFAFGISKNGTSVDQGTQCNGVYDDGRVYSRVLSLAEIVELYNSGNGTEGE